MTDTTFRVILDQCDECFFTRPCVELGASLLTDGNIKLVKVCRDCLSEAIELAEEFA